MRSGVAEHRGGRLNSEAESGRLVSLARMEAAAALLRARRHRDAIFGADRDGFGEPAWDMLLALTAAGGAMPADELVAASCFTEGSSRLFVQWLASRQLVAIDGGEVSLAQRVQAAMTSVLGNGESGSHG